MQAEELLKGALVGETITDVAFQGELLILTTGDCTLSILSPWRYYGLGSFVGIGSIQVMEITARITGQVIMEVKLQNDFHDLRIFFGDGSVMETFQESSDYESWNLARPSGKTGAFGLIVAGPAAQIAVFPSR